MGSRKSNRLQNWGRQLVTAVAASLVLLAIIIKVATFQRQPWLFAAGGIVFYILLFLSFIFRYACTESVEQKPKHWFFALSGTLLPFLMSLTPYKITWLIWLSVPLELLGILLAIVALFTLGRSFGIIAAKREIKTHGVYQVIRHPLYAGEALWFLALVLQNPSRMNIALFIVQSACQCSRILEEERLLGKDLVYARYIREVRWRIIPGVF